MAVVAFPQGNENSGQTDCGSAKFIVADFQSGQTKLYREQIRWPRRGLMADKSRLMLQEFLVRT